MFEVDIVEGFGYVVLNGEAVNINEWLIRNGFGLLDSDGLSDEWTKRLQVAEDSAEAESLGVWGHCALPEPYAIAGVPTSVVNATEDVLALESFNGDQVVEFSIDAAGTYLFMLDDLSGEAVFVAMDVYTGSGEWQPALSMSTTESGTFTSAGYLAPGEYFYQVKAVGQWRVTIDPL
jgi:hypothetical protein